MSDTTEARAEARRANWSGGRVPLRCSDAELELRFWADATSSQKFDAVWEMAMEAWTLKNGNESVPRLDVTCFGVRPLDS